MYDYLPVGCKGPSVPSGHFPGDHRCQKTAIKTCHFRYFSQNVRARVCASMHVYSPEAPETCGTVSPKGCLEGTKILSNDGAKKDFIMVMKYVVNVNSQCRRVAQKALVTMDCTSGGLSRTERGADTRGLR